MNIREIVVNHYGPLRDVELKLKQGLQIIFGPNESGKTLLIDAALKMMLGASLKDFEHIDRVPGLPTGRMVMQWQNKELVLDGNTTLSSETDMDPGHLRNIFVVRNKDVQIAREVDYFRRLNDQLTGVETLRLERMRTLVQQAGKLTNPSSNARISNTQGDNKLAGRVDEAKQLADEIKQYSEMAREQQLDMLELDLEQQKKELTDTEQAMDRQREAQQHHRYQQIVELAEKHQQLDSQLEKMKHFSTAAERDLLSLENRQQGIKQEIAGTQQELKQERKKRDNLNSELDQARVQQGVLDSKVQQGQKLLDSSKKSAFDLKPWLVAVLLAAAVGLAWLSVPTSQVVLAVAGGVLAILTAVLLALALIRRGGEARFVQQAIALGFSGKTQKEITDLLAQMAEEQLVNDEKIRQLEFRIRQQADLCQRLEDTLIRRREQANEMLQQLNRELQTAGVQDSQEFFSKVEEAGIIRNQLQHTETRLEEVLGPLPSQQSWQQLVNQLDVPPAGEEYVPGQLEKLEQKKEQLQQQREELREQLAQHTRQLDSFCSAARELQVEQELDREVPRHCTGLDMLDYIAQLLKEFINTVEQRYHAACQAIAVLEEIEQEEEAKMGQLLGPDKPVQQLFADISGGRYTGVSLNEDLKITVTRKDQVELPATHLSQGTFDQLYLALRLSLAQDILQKEQGFLLLDDAFLCADDQRRTRLLDILSQLAEKNWQIIYFTMDQQLAKEAGKLTANKQIELKPLP